MSVTCYWTILCVFVYKRNCPLLFWQRNLHCSMGILTVLWILVILGIVFFFAAELCMRSQVHWLQILIAEYYLEWKWTDICNSFIHKFSKKIQKCVLVNWLFIFLFVNILYAIPSDNTGSLKFSDWDWKNSIIFILVPAIICGCS